MSAIPAGGRSSSSGVLSLSAYLVLAVGLLIGEALGHVSTSFALALLSVQLLAYLAAECAVLAYRGPDRILIVAPVAASLLTFAIPFALTNALYLIPVESRPGELDIPTEISPAMVKVTGLAIVGALGMWLGFKSSIGSFLARIVLRDLRVARTLAQEYVLNPVAVSALVVTSVTARIIAIHLGIFGYSADPLSLMQWVELRQYLSLADSGGDIALLIVALAAFGPRPSSALRTGLAIVFLLEIGFGLLSGFKGQVIMPVIITGVAYYARRGRIPLLAIAGFVVAVALSYQLIQPFRALSYEDSAFRGTSIMSITEALAKAQASETSSTGASFSDNVLQTLSRIHGTYIASLGVQYADEVSELPDDAPRFLENIALSPLHAVVPRFLWPDKPTGTVGSWYRKEVLGIDDDTSVGMSAMTYLYLGGGYLAVLLALGGVGVLQRFFTTVGGTGSGGMLIYLGLFVVLVQIDSAFDSVPVNLIRGSVLLWVVQWLAFRK